MLERSIASSETTVCCLRVTITVVQYTQRINVEVACLLIGDRYNQRTNWMYVSHTLFCSSLFYLSSLRSSFGAFLLIFYRNVNWDLSSWYTRSLHHPNWTARNLHFLGQKNGLDWEQGFTVSSTPLPSSWSLLKRYGNQKNRTKRRRVKYQWWLTTSRWLRGSARMLQKVMTTLVEYPYHPFDLFNFISISFSILLSFFLLPPSLSLKFNSD